MTPAITFICNAVLQVGSEAGPRQQVISFPGIWPPHFAKLWTGTVFSAEEKKGKWKAWNKHIFQLGSRWLAFHIFHQYRK